MKKQTGFFLTVFGSAAVLFMRLYAYSNWIDPSAHIYTTDSPWRFLPGLTVIIAAVLALVCFAVPGDEKPLCYPGGKQIVSGIGMLLLTCGIGLSGADILLHYELFRISFFSPASILFLTFFAAALIGTVGMAVILFAGKKNRCPVFFTLAPLPFLFIRFLCQYIGSFRTEEIAELPWKILMLASECIFFLFFARRMAGFKDRRTVWSDSFFAALTVLLGTACFGTHLCLCFTAPDLIPSGRWPSAADGAVWITALIELGSLTFGRPESDHPAEEPDSMV